MKDWCTDPGERGVRRLALVIHQAAGGRIYALDVPTGEVDHEIDQLERAGDAEWATSLTMASQVMGLMRAPATTSEEREAAFDRACRDVDRLIVPPPKKR